MSDTVHIQQETSVAKQIKLLFQRAKLEGLERVCQHIRGLKEQGSILDDGRSIPSYGYIPGLPSSPITTELVKNVLPAFRDSVPKLRGELVENTTTASGVAWTRPSYEKAHRYILLRGLGTWRPEAMSFPETSRLVNSLSDVRLGTEVRFSSLPAGSVIPSHSDSTNLFITLSICITSGPTCVFTVEDTVIQQEAGNVFSFDASFMHSARNDGDGERTVLLIDLWHPGLSNSEVDILRQVQLLLAKRAQPIVANRADARQSERLSP